MCYTNNLISFPSVSDYTLKIPSKSIGEFLYLGKNITKQRPTKLLDQVRYAIHTITKSDREDGNVNT
jgi:hypothetical protein